MGARCPLCNSVFVEQWERMYALLLDYKAEHGNISIPKRAVYKGEKLGLWCQHQRDNYNCNKRTMTPERVKKLSDIGFDFDPKETEWNRRYEQYLRYIEEKVRHIYQGEQITKTSILVRGWRPREMV